MVDSVIVVVGVCLTTVFVLFLFLFVLLLMIVICFATLSEDGLKFAGPLAHGCVGILSLVVLSCCQNDPSFLLYRDPAAPERDAR